MKYELRQLKELPEEPIICYLEVVVMPNGDIIHLGKIVGQFHNHKKYVYIAVQKEKRRGNNRRDK